MIPTRPYTTFTLIFPLDDIRRKCCETLYRYIDTWVYAGIDTLIKCRYTEKKNVLKDLWVYCSWERVGHVWNIYAHHNNSNQKKTTCQFCFRMANNLYGVHSIPLQTNSIEMQSQSINLPSYGQLQLLNHVNTGIK